MTAEEHRVYSRNHYKLNKNMYSKRRRKYNLKQRYNISLKEYNQLFKKQKGNCKICGKHQRNFVKRLAVDHCHKTGEVRALLCTKCNYAIGYMDENPKLMIKAAKYLINHNL